MVSKIYLILFLSFFFLLETFSQNQAVLVKGRVFNIDGGTPLPYVNVYTENKSKFGTTTNEEGFFSISIDSELFIKNSNLIFSSIV